MKHLLAILFCFPIVACVNGRYAGPPLNIGVEFMGVKASVGIAGAVGAATGILVSADNKVIKPLHPADAP